MIEANRLDKERDLRRAALASLFLIAVTLLVYSRTFGSGFVSLASGDDRLASEIAARIARFRRR